MRLRIPRLVIPPSAEEHVRLAEMDDTEIQEHTHAFQFCPVCRYVLCSCGNCHSEECGDVCLIELGA